MRGVRVGRPCHPLPLSSIEWGVRPCPRDVLRAEDDVEGRGSEWRDRGTVEAHIPRLRVRDGYGRLTDVAESLGADDGSVTDIFLPRWIAYDLPAIHVPLILLAAFLHGRNLRKRSPRRTDIGRHRRAMRLAPSS